MAKKAAKKAARRPRRSGRRGRTARARCRETPPPRSPTRAGPRVRGPAATVRALGIGRVVPERADGRSCAASLVDLRKALMKGGNADMAKKAAKKAAKKTAKKR